MRSNATKEILQDIARKYGYSERDILEMVSFQFKFLKEQISSGNVKTQEFATIKLAHIGTFLVSRERIKHLKQRHERSSDKR